MRLASNQAFLSMAEKYYTYLATNLQKQPTENQVQPQETSSIRYNLNYGEESPYIYVKKVDGTLVHLDFPPEGVQFKTEELLAVLEDLIHQADDGKDATMKISQHCTS